MIFKHWEWIGDLIGRTAMLNPNREALVDLDTGMHYSSGHLNDRANRLANYLAEQLDIQKGDRVAILSRNRVEMLDVLFACGKCGAIFVPYNVRLTPGELAQLIEKEEPKVLFYEDVFDSVIRKLKSQLSTLKYYISFDEAKSHKEVVYTEMVSYSNNFPRKCQELGLEDIYLLIHTGGTTGLPKGAMISHRAVLYNQLNNVLDWGLDSDKTFHLLLPLFHTGGLNLLTLPILSVGGRVLINRTFDSALTLKVISDYKPNYVFGAATIFRMLADHPEFGNSDWSSVEWVMSGAAPTPVQLMEKYWGKGIKMCLGYGLTEGGPTNIATPVRFMTFDQIKEKHASVGKPFYFTTAKVVDPDGNEVKDGEVGEVIFTGPQIFSGYWRNEEETRKTLRDGWVYTGDMVQKDEDGFYTIVGRKKNMFISGGENVFPPEIETVLYQIPEIHECCVIGVTDEKWGEVGKVVVSLRSGQTLTKEKVITFLKTKLAPYKVPRYVVFVQEVPKNSVGKIIAQEVTRVYGVPKDE